MRTPWPTDVAEYRDIGGEPFRYTFDEPGMYEFICSLHGSGMSGMVIVLDDTGNQPPAASPVVAPKTGAAPLVVHFTANAMDPDGDAFDLVWDFGTGGSQATADHAMFEYTTPGDYTASLLVTDSQGGVYEQEFPITVTDGEEPGVTAAADPTSGPAPLHVAFTAQAPGEHAHHYTYSWDFGDGTTGTGLTPEHTYVEPADYTAVVTVTSGATEIGTAQVSISATDGRLPQIEAKATPAHGDAPAEVSFTTAVTTSGQFHSYSHGLTSTPDLTGTAEIVRERGATTASVDVTGVQPNRFHQVHVHEQACTSNLGGAHFRFDETQPFVEENEIWPYFTSDAEGHSGLVQVTQPLRAGDKAVSIVIHDPDNPALRIGCVDLTPSTADLEYTWDFGDGTTGEGPDPDHTYTAPGHYEATVTVAHASGAVITDTLQLTVGEGGEEPEPITAGAVSIDGLARVGSVVTAVSGPWAPAPVELSYQWLRDGAVIAGATSSTYTIVAADADKSLSVRVTGSKAGHVSVSVVSAPRSVQKPAPTFVDVPSNHQFLPEISWLASSGISAGWSTPQGAEFRPSNSVTRDAMAAFLYRFAGSPEFTAPAVSPFRDVPRTHQFYKEITWLADAGISTGWSVPGGKEFRPSNAVTRDAMAAFMYRFADSPSFTPPSVSPFRDVPSTHQFYKQVTWLADAGISRGWTTSGGAEFRSSNKVTRDAMAAFLFRLDGYVND